MIQALAIAIAVGLLAAGVQTYRLSLCQTDAAELRGSYLLLAEKVKEQNAAVSAVEREAAAAREKGRRAAIAAKAEVQAKQADVDRLRALLAASRPTGDCPAGRAVTEVRKGLK